MGLGLDEIRELMKREPERYEIVQCENGTRDGDIFENEDGKQVIVLKAGYPRVGFCVVDTQPKQELRKTGIDKGSAQKPSKQMAGRLADRRTTGTGEKLILSEEELSEVEEELDERDVKVIEQATGMEKNESSRIVFFDILSEHFGDMSIKRVKLTSGESTFTIICFKNLPFVFIAFNLEKCFQKLVKFILKDCQDLIGIYENKELRGIVRQIIEDGD